MITKGVIFKCDRCGKEHFVDGGTIADTEYPSDWGKHISFEGGANMHLCPDCNCTYQVMIADFLKG